MRRLLKFKANDEGTTVKYEDTGDSDVGDTITLESTDKPTKELRDALQGMAEHLLEICEMPSTWQEGIKVIGVTLTYTNDVGGLVITALRTLEGSNAPMVINSPHFTEAPYSEGGDESMSIYSERCGEAIETLEKQVFAFVDGTREQLALDFAEATPEPAHVGAN